MQVDTMNESQMMILESFAGAQDEQELNALMDVLSCAASTSVHHIANRDDERMSQDYTRY